MLETFAAEETTWGMADTLRAWMKEHGIPSALYVDWKTVYHHQPTARQSKRPGSVSQLAGCAREAGDQADRAQFTAGQRRGGARARDAPGSADQENAATGDRPVRNGQRVSAGSYRAQHNTRCGATQEDADYHLRVPPRLDLEQVFCLEEERKVSQDWVVQNECRWLQIEAKAQRTPVHAGSTVMVREHRNGSLTLLLNQQKLRWHELTERPKRPPQIPKRRLVRRPKPAPDHPWRTSLLAAQRYCGLAMHPIHHGVNTLRAGEGAQPPSLPCTPPGFQSA